MNAKPDSPPTSKPPRDPVEGWLTALGAGELSLDEARERLVERCSRDQDAAWSALSWLDQYHRRRVIDRDTYLDLKRRVTGVALPGGTRAMAARAATDAASAAVTPLPAAPRATIAGAPATPPADLERAPAHPARAAATPATVVPRRPLEAGAVLLDRYELEAEIGHGAMAVVFSARDRERRNIDGLRDQIAIKALRSDLDARDGALELLRRECFLTQSLSHANVVNVYGWERDGDTRFITLEFLDGQSLEDLLADLGPRRLRHDHAVAIIGAIGQALAHAHASGVVHGDLKPGNVMIGADGHVRVLGFAHTIPDPQNPSYELDGLRMVTPRYASPDVLQGLHPTASDDVFSLGCIACELLCGATPFPDGADARRRSRLRKPRGMRRRDWPQLRKALAPERGRRPSAINEWTASLAEDSQAPLPALREMVDRAARPPRFVALRWLTLIAVFGAAGAVAVHQSRQAAPATAERALHASTAEVAAGSDAVPDDVASPDVIGAVPAGAVLPIDRTPAPATSGAATSPATPPGASAPQPLVTPLRNDRPFVAMVADTVGARESNGAVRIPVQRYGNLSKPLEFTWWTEPGTAVPGVDYADLEVRSTRFAPGEGRITLVVPLVDDVQQEGPESFSVRLRVDRPGADPGFAASSVTIIDDDSPARADDAEPVVPDSGAN